MNHFLGRASRRFYLRHPWQMGLAIAGIALGVAVYVGVALANDSARRAFELSADTIRGHTTHRLLPIGSGIPERDFRELVMSGQIGGAAPIVEQSVRITDDNGSRYTLLGVDPLQEAGFRDYSSFAPGTAVAASGTAGAAALIATPGSVLIPARLAARLRLADSSALELRTDSGRHSVEIAGIIGAAAAGGDVATPIVTDISTAQMLSGHFGVLSRIDLRLDARQARRLRAHLPPGTALVSAGANAGSLSQMTRAFRTNLTALSLLALVVGMFLIYATMSFAVVQRRSVIGMLRAIGVPPRDVLGNIMLEAGVIGVVGTLAGLMLGRVLALGLVGMVLQTLGDLYFSSEVRAVSPSPWIYAQAAALGLGATLVAALGPAIDASRCTPDAALRRASLERATLRRSKIAAACAVPVLLVAGGLLLGHGLTAGFAALFAVLCAGALLTPGATAGLMKLLAPLAARLSLESLLAVRGVRASLSRTGVATAALAVAVATVIGIGLMIGSFRSSLVDWLDTTLSADIYVTLDDAGAAPPLPAATLHAIDALPGVLGVGLTRFTRLPTRYGRLGLRALQPGPKGWGLDVVGAGAKQALARLTTSNSVAISEAFAYRAGLSVGDDIVLPTAIGNQRFSICAVFRDYNTGGGSVAISLARYRRDWRDERVSGIGVHLTRGADRRRTISALEAMFAGRGVDVRSTDAIERLSLQIFDRTFRITEVLRILAGLIAFFGVLSAAMAIQLERGRELAVLRALGFAPEQLARLSLVQTGLLGLAAGFVAMPLGTALAALLVYVINRRSFGWTMHLVAAPGPIAIGVALAIGAALLAGIYPAMQSRRVHWQGALREE